MRKKIFGQKFRGKRRIVLLAMVQRLLVADIAEISRSARRGVIMSNDNGRLTCQQCVVNYAPVQCVCQRCCERLVELGLM